jgi:riboflavin kinase / FMN adenylyltransferase
MIHLLRGLHNVTAVHKGCVATIGNFDGLHQGHQAVIQVLGKEAKRLHLPSCVILFEPHPQEFFCGVKAPARLMRLREKVKIFQNLAVDRIICLRFDKHLAQMKAGTFVKKILVDRLGIRLLIVGDDFRFGKDRQGNFVYLKKLAKRYHFTVIALPSLLFDGKRIGSSRVRTAVKEGNFALASYLLTRPFILSGRVMHGDQRGHLLGFPTANIALHRLVSPVSGVFIVQVHGLGAKPLPAVANCGRRPTVGGVKNILEIHILNFDETIYGHCLQVEFLKKIRDEKKFASLAELRKQISVDVMTAKKYFHLQ